MTISYFFMEDPKIILWSLSNHLLFWRDDAGVVAAVDIGVGEKIRHGVKASLVPPVFDCWNQHVNDKGAGHGILLTKLPTKLLVPHASNG